jgi:HK97 family phage major capsid protein
MCLWGNRFAPFNFEVTEGSYPVLQSAAEVTPNRWFINGADFIALRKLKESGTSSKYLLESDVTSGPTYRLFGIPVTVTNKLAEGKAVLAGTRQIAVGRDLAPSVMMWSERYADLDDRRSVW